MAQKMVNLSKFFNAEAISAGAVAYTDPVIDLAEWRPDGYYGIQVHLTGDGTLKMEWFISADGKNYLVPSGYDNVICQNFTKTTGSHSIEVGDSVFIFGASGMTEINQQTATIAATAAGTVTTDIDSSGYSAYTSGGTVRPVAKAADADAVITGITKANPAVISVNRGRDWFRVTIPPTPYLKIKATETGGANAIALNAWLVGV